MWYHIFYNMQRSSQTHKEAHLEICLSKRVLHLREHQGFAVHLMALKEQRERVEPGHLTVTEPPSENQCRKWGRTLDCSMTHRRKRLTKPEGKANQSPQIQRKNQEVWIQPDTRNKTCCETRKLRSQRLDIYILAEACLEVEMWIFFWP